MTKSRNTHIFNHFHVAGHLGTSREKVDMKPVPI